MSIKKIVPSTFCRAAIAKKCKLRAERTLLRLAFTGLAPSCMLLQDLPPVNGSRLRTHILVLYGV